MIGGDAFRIKKLSSSANLSGDILVGGILEEFYLEGDDAGSTFLTSFLYMLKTSDCSVSWSYEFANITTDAQPQVAWSYDEKYAYMIGNSESSDGSEYLVIMKDPQMTMPFEEQGGPDIYGLRTGVDSTPLESNGLFGHPYNNY